ncbi:MAG: maleylpyruvate isomerase family mycothiol-dependent enzyme [Actinomycetia bacterium]|nr:maleylpyruvate isomerase family mycothiol-dependent enzyme [Actinomycetes bacterium]
MAADFALSPAAPSALNELIDAFEQTARAVLELGRACPPERAGDPTPCPGWDVFAQVAHVESLEAIFSGEPMPDLSIEERPHVRNDMGVIVEVLIESRRGLSLVELCDQFEEVLGRRLEQLRSAEVTEETELPGPFGMMTAPDLLGVRCFDIWCHEQDLRETLDLPGNLSTPAAAESMRRVFGSFGRIAVASGLAVGQSVRLELTGPVTGRHDVSVVDQGGKVRGIAATVDPEELACTLRLDTRVAGRLIAGRDPVGQDVRGGGFAWTCDGDRDLAQALVRHFAVTP